MRCLNKLYKFDDLVRLEDVFIGYTRMKVRNWHVRGAINSIHFKAQLDKTRPYLTPAQVKQVKAMVVVLTNSNQDGTVDVVKVMKGLRSKSELRSMANHKSFLEILKAMQEHGLLAKVENPEKEMVEVDADTKLELVLEGRKWLAPKVQVKRKWDGEVEPSVRLRLEREGLTMDE